MREDARELPPPGKEAKELLPPPGKKAVAGRLGISGGAGALISRERADVEGEVGLARLIGDCGTRRGKLFKDSCHPVYLLTNWFYKTEVPESV